MTGESASWMADIAQQAVETTQKPTKEEVATMNAVEFFELPSDNLTRVAVNALERVGHPVVHNTELPYVRRKLNTVHQ